MKKFPEAIQSYKRAIALNPNSSESYFNLGIAYGESGRNQEGIDALKNVIRLNPKAEPKVLSSIAVLYAESNKFPEAESAFQRAILLNPKDGELHAKLGLLYYNAKKLNEAIESFEKALELSPFMYPTLYNLGLVYQNVGKVDQAKAVAVKLREYKQDDFAEKLEARLK